MADEESTEKETEKIKEELSTNKVEDSTIEENIKTDIIQAKSPDKSITDNEASQISDSNQDTVSQTTDDQSEISNDELLNKSHSDSKPKWKLKIRMNQGSPEKSKKWEVVSGDKPRVEYKENTDIDSNTDQEMIDVCTPIETPSMAADISLSVPSLKRKIKKKASSAEATPPKKPKGGLRSDCPPFCKSSCTLEHHPLLVGARKMIENDSGTTLVFLDMINSYYGGSNGNMQASDSIADPGKHTNFPLLHYIALMGKCAGCFAMVDAGHDPEKVVTEMGDTVLHTIVKEMYVFNCTHGHMDILLKKFNLLLKEFKVCLLVTNKSWQNPLHLCADLISQTAFQCAQSGRVKPPFRLYQFQKNMLGAMLDQFKIDGLESSMLNMTDNKQNTFSHYLALDRASHDILDMVKEIGADFGVCNDENMNVEQVMDNAPPPPPGDILEMAVFSAKGRKYKSSHQKPVVQMTKSPSMTKSKRTIKPSAKAKAVEEDLIYETFSRDLIKFEKKKDKKTVQKLDTDLTEPPFNPIIPTSQIISGLSQIKKGRVKVTPTRKEKDEEKLSKKMAKLQNTQKENSEYEKAPKFIVFADAPSGTQPISNANSVNTTILPATTVVKILPKMPFANSSNTFPTIIGKVKPTVITKPLNPSLPDPKLLQNKLEISPMLPNNIRPPVSATTIVVNQALSQRLPLQTQGIAPPHSTINQPNLSKPILFKTAEGQVLQLQNVSPQVIQANQSNQRFPLQTNQNKTFSNNNPQVNQIRGMQMLGMQIRPMQLGTMVNGQPQIQPMMNNQSHTRPNNQPHFRPMNINIRGQQAVNINGKWVLRCPRPMVSPPGQIPRGPLSPNHYYQHPNFMQNNVFQPSNTHPGNMFQSPSMTSHPSLSMVRPQRPQPPINNRMSTPVAPQNTTIRPILSPLNASIQPVKQHKVINTKRGRNLEASIQNLQNISMEIISRNFGNPNDNSLATPKSNPETQPQPTPQPNETAPPVYIIDTDDEKHILTEEMMKKQTPSPTPSSDEHKVDDSENANHKEHIAEKRCKYQVELPFHACQHFEQFLLISRLNYSKIECQGEHDDATSSSNPFLPENDPDRNQSVENPKDLAVELLEWFSLNKYLCKEHFARIILQGNLRHLEDLLSMVDLQENLSSRETKDMIKIQHFLCNRELQKALSCSCKDSLDDIDNAHHQHQLNNHHPQPPVPTLTPRSPLLHQHRKAFWEDDLISQREVQQIAEALKAWLHRHHWVSQGYFATHYLNRSQGTISHLLRWATAPTSRQGEEVWHRIKHFLENQELQESFSLKAKKYKASQTSSSSSQLQQSSSNLMVHQEKAQQQPPPPPSSSRESPPAPTLLKTSATPTLIKASSTTDDHQTNPDPQPSTSTPLHDIEIGTFTQENIHELADHLSQWLYRNPIISQARFSKHVLQRSQGTLSSLLKMRCMPISRAGYEVWHKIRDFLNDTDKQETLLRNYGWVGSFKEVKNENGDEQMTPGEEADVNERREDRKRPHLENRISIQPETKHPILHPPLTRPSAPFPFNSRIDNPQDSVSITTRHRGPASDVPTISVSPYKVKRLGEFDQDTVTRLANQLKDWLDNQTRVSQGLFAQRVLARSQGTLSLLLARKTAPISTSGEDVWRKIRDFLQDERKQQELINFAHQQN